MSSHCMSISESENRNSHCVYTSRSTRVHSHICLCNGKKRRSARHVYTHRLVQYLEKVLLNWCKDLHGNCTVLNRFLLVVSCRWLRSSAHKKLKLSTFSFSTLSFSESGLERTLDFMTKWNSNPRTLWHFLLYVHFFNWLFCVCHRKSSVGSQLQTRDSVAVSRALPDDLRYLQLRYTKA